MAIASSNSHRNPNLAMAVRDRFLHYPPLRLWREGINVDAHDGTVVLSGMVRSRALKNTAVQFAGQVKGVSAVENRLIADDELEVAVAQALASDPRTRTGFPGILVGVVFGVVYLKGTVASAEIKNASGEIASKVPGVKRVSNELVALAQPKPAAAKAPG